MTEAITLPPGVAVGILAFLLSLLPAGLFIWLWYLRRHDRPVPILLVVQGFIGGMILTMVALKLEQWTERFWLFWSPETAHYFGGAILPLRSPVDILLPAVATFLVVALIEEGLRYGTLFVWFRLTRSMDQVFDGLVLGLVVGLGFATLENTLYFFRLFSTGMFDTLVFVFFLRFLVSTLAHISFGGIMGVLLARGMFAIYGRGWLYLQAFAVSWFIHGLFNLLLGINQTVYAILLLLPPLLVLIIWSGRRDYFIISRVGGKILVARKAPHSVENTMPKKLISPWNHYAPWLRGRRV